MGGTLLVTAEQGLGDTLQFVRYLPLLAAQGHSVVFEAQVPVFTLLWHSLGRHGVRVVPRTETPARVHDDLPFARHVPLLSLPERFGTRLDSVPADTPYLFAEPSRQALWRDRLDAVAGPRRRIGIAWQGRPAHARDRERSIPAAALGPWRYRTSSSSACTRPTADRGAPARTNRRPASFRWTNCCMTSPRPRR
ncbi:hypothetical protein [Azospirillum doebereinerae]